MNLRTSPIERQLPFLFHCKGHRVLTFLEFQDFPCSSLNDHIGKEMNETPYPSTHHSRGKTLWENYVGNSFRDTILSQVPAEVIAGAC